MSREIINNNEQILTSETVADCPMKVAIRGAGGLLGHRLLRAILRTQDDMEVDCVILGTDEPSFRRLQSACRRLSELPKFKVFIDARRRLINDLIKDWDSPWELQPLDQAWNELKKMDAIVDTAIVPGHDKMKDFLESYSVRHPVIHQSGIYPKYNLIAPPFEPDPKPANLNYRQGDCLISGIAPILFPFKEIVEHVDLRLLVQRQSRLNDYTLRDNLDDIIINPNLEDRVKDEVSNLMPNVEPGDIEISVFESPGHDYYMCEFKLCFTESVTREEILDKLENQPRVLVAPKEIPISTGQLQQQLREPNMENGSPLQPVVCFSCPGGIKVNGKVVTIRAAFYSKAITMLPNIDSIRGLVRKMTLEKAMRITDCEFGF